MRPEIPKDIPREKLKGATVAMIDMQQLPADGPLIAAVGSFLQRLESSGLIVRKEYSTIHAYAQPTEDEIEQILKVEQRQWDRAKDYYEAALVSGTEPEYYAKSLIIAWCRTENKLLPWAEKDGSDD